MVAYDFEPRLTALGLALPPTVVRIANSHTRPVR
jgi:hypothetical protein